MKTIRNIKALFRNAAISTHPAADQTVLTDALQAGGLTSHRRSARRARTIGRFLMERRMTKLAAVAILIAAAILGVPSFNGTAVKAVEFSEITKAMEQVPWMRMTPSGLESEGAETERWFGFESKIHAVKWTDGDVDFESVTDHKRFTYKPSSNTITIIYMEEDVDFDLTSPTRWLESLHKMLEEQGAKTTVRMGDYQGCSVQIQEISHPDIGKNYTLYIDPETKRLYAGKVAGVDATGKLAMGAHLDFDYPPTGPQSIYDLGVPRDARVVDMTPSANFRPVWEEYLRRKAELPNQYIAVIVHQEKSPSAMVRMLDVNYKSGRGQRYEHYDLFRGEVIAELGPQYREPLGSRIGPLLAWARSRYDDPRTLRHIELDDGQYYIKAHRDGFNHWGELDKALSPVHGARMPMTLPQAWPVIASTSQVIEDDYARQNGLICIENLTQGQVIRDFGVSNPGRFLWYLDPVHDYLCRRQVMEWRPDADWQQDRNWLKDVDPKKVKVRGGAMLVCEIPEVFQAPNGHWYPRVIIEKEKYTDTREDYRNAPMKVTDVKTIYLDVSPTFPEGIFDRNRLPGQ